MDIWDAVWLCWLVIFGVLEAVALHRNATGDTLSENVRQWFATEKDPKGPALKVRRLSLLAFLAWLCVHFLTKGGFV